MSFPEKRWAQLADDLEFEQLGGARKQAEGWRTGLAGLTALLAAVTILKGPENIDMLAGRLRYVVVLLLVTAFVLLVVGSLTATRAAAGDPGAMIYQEADQLREWTLREAQSVGSSIKRAARCMVLGLGALALATGLAWLGPRAPTDPTLVTVEVGGAKACGALLTADAQAIVIKEAGKGAVRKIDFAPDLRVLPASKC